MAKWPVLCVLSTLIAAVGCGDDGRAQMAPPNSNSGGGTPVSSGGTEETDSGTDDAGPGETGGMSESGGMSETGGAMDPDGGVPDGSVDDGGIQDGGSLDPARLFPVVSFLSPDAATAQDSPDVVTDRTITVRCSATASEVDGGLPVNAEKVAITMLASVNADPFSSAAVPTVGFVDQVSGSESEFEADFNLAEYPNGALAFMCSAVDTAEPPNKVETETKTLLDLGPIIQVDSPLSGSILALKQPVFVAFSVVESPMLDPDPGAEIESVTLEVLGAPINLSPGVEVGEYTASIDFDDRSVFDAPPATAELVFRATNKRAAGPVTRTERVNITLDAAGPEITIETPQPGEIIRGEITIRLTATDPSGVTLNRLVARIPDPDSPNGLIELTDWKLVDDEYTHRFDTNALADDRNQVLINISAFDSVGNESIIGLSVVQDNQPPIVSLNPPAIREYYDVGENDYCTVPFDPVGDDAYDDLDIAPNGAAMFRTIAWDRTNGNPDTIDYLAKTNEDDVILFVRRDDGIPLLINAAGDPNGPCDEIATDPGNASQRPFQWALVPLTPRGKALADSADTYTSSVCPAPVPVNRDATDPRCDDSVMTRVTAQNTVASSPPLAGIFAYDAKNNTGLSCDGNSIELANQLGTGWQCVAVRASDYKGNIGVSAPLRIWVKSSPSDPDPPDLAAAPSCTDGCVPPPNLSSGLLFPTQ